MPTPSLDQLNDRMLPLARMIGVRLTRAEPDLVEAELAVSADHCTVGSRIHGGAVMALADTLGGIGAFLNLPDGSAGTTTIESKTNFVGPAAAGTTVTARCTPVHRGRRTQVWQTRIETEDGRLVALTTQTQMTL